MKLTTIINSVAILIFLSGFGALFHKIQTASLSNPFVNNTVALTHRETDY
ncbi:hypothetical protein [Aphanothece sacrum]|nr:hypothetical protein [Aphanothece sacrum]